MHDFEFEAGDIRCRKHVLRDALDHGESGFM